MASVVAVPLIVKYIRNLFESKYSTSMVNMVCSAICKYHVVDKDSGIPIGQHSLVSMAKKLCGNKDLQSLNIVLYMMSLSY